MGLLTQPISCIGLPVVTVPLWGQNPDAPHLPIGVQVIAAPWREDLALRVAAAARSAGHRAARRSLRLRERPATRMDINLPDVHAEVSARVRALRRRARQQQARRARRAVLAEPAHGALRRAARTSSASTRSARFATHARRSGWRARLSNTVITTYGARLRDGDDRVPARRQRSHGPPEPDLGALRRRAGGSSRRTSACWRTEMEAFQSSADKLALRASGKEKGAQACARQGRRVVDFAHVPRGGLRPPLLLYFATSATRRPRRETPILRGRRTPLRLPIGTVGCCAERSKGGGDGRRPAPGDMSAVQHRAVPIARRNLEHVGLKCCA